MLRGTAGQKWQLFGRLLCAKVNITSLPSLLLILCEGRVGISHRDRSVIKSTYGSTHHISLGIQIKRCKYGIITGLCTKSFLFSPEITKRGGKERGEYISNSNEIVKSLCEVIVKSQAVVKYCCQMRVFFWGGGTLQTVVCTLNSLIWVIKVLHEEMNYATFSCKRCTGRKLSKNMCKSASKCHVQ